MDTCHYCGRQYHPMPVYTRPGSRIHVCHFRLATEEEQEAGYDWRVPTDCRDRAVADEYKYRCGLTPRR